MFSLFLFCDYFKSFKLSFFFLPIQTHAVFSFLLLVFLFVSVSLVFLSPSQQLQLEDTSSQALSVHLPFPSLLPLSLSGCLSIRSFSFSLSSLSQLVSQLVPGLPALL